MYQPNYRPKLKNHAYDLSLSNFNQEDVEELQKPIENRLDTKQNIDNQVASVSNSEVNEQKSNQNNTAILPKNKKNKITEKHQHKLQSSFQVTTPKSSLMMIEYKLIGINKLDHLNFFNNLIPPGFKQLWQNDGDLIALRGISAEVNKKKIGLILADISANNQIATIIHLSILPEFSYFEIGSKLIHCMETSLAKFNCNQLIFNQETLAIKNKAQTLI